MNTKTYTVSQIVPIDAPLEYKQSALDVARRKMGNKLYDILYQNKLPATVDIEEHITQLPNSQDFRYVMDYPRWEIRIVANITPVQYRKVVLYEHHPDYYATWSIKQIKHGFLSKWLRRLFHI